jgi:hypothetical protein
MESLYHGKKLFNHHLLPLQYRLRMNFRELIPRRFINLLAHMARNIIWVNVSDMAPGQCFHLLSANVE